MMLRYAPRAIQDLHDIRNYLIAHASAKAADVIRRHLRARIDWRRIPSSALRPTILVFAFCRRRDIPIAFTTQFRVTRL
jgi:plasmid stabilization system protein ParE